MICYANQWAGFLYDRDLRHERVKQGVHVTLINPLTTNVPHHIETSQFIWSAN